MSVIDEIAAERQRQITDEIWTPAHDDGHNDGELAEAAACYTIHGLAGFNSDRIRRAMWPWDEEGWKPKDMRRNLIRAAALIVAEIERLDRRAVPTDEQR